MAAYDYRCLTCTAVFEVQRSVLAADAVSVCPSGHPDTTRVWSAVGLAAGADPARPAAGGCCGGGCCG